MNKNKPKFPIGTRVKIINEKFRNGEVAYVEKVRARMILNELMGYTYYIKFKDRSVASFFEANIEEESRTSHLKKTKPMENITEKFLKIGAISAGFNEVDIPRILTEATEAFIIKEVTGKDVRSKHFIDWFFKMHAWWTDMPIPKFPFNMITHCDEYDVYGYFNGNKLNGIIRIDDDGGDEYELTFFFVNKAQQNKGIGQSIFQYVLSKYGDKALSLNVYTDNAPAIHIYKKYGFKITGTGYGLGHRPKAPHYIMKRTKDEK